MKQGKVCEKHQEFSPDGECRWCEPPPSEVPAAPFARAAQKMIDAAKERIADQLIYGIGTLQPPLPVASCKHDGVLYMYGTTTSCATCGKVLSAPAASTSMLPVAHYTFCPLKGPVDAGDLARGCVCVPFP